MSSSSFLRLALVRCPGCGRRNATDPWRRLRGARATCGSCGARLPWRLPRPVLVALPVVLALLAGLVVLVAGSFRGRFERRFEVELAALAEQGRFDEAARRLLERGGSAAARERLVLIIVRRLEAVARAERPPLERLEQAYRSGDELLAVHGPAWPELAGRIAAPLDELRRRREVARLAESVASLARREAPSLGEVEEALRRAEGELRRLGPGALRDLAGRAAPAWDEARLAAARSLVAGDPAAAALALRRPFPLEAVPAELSRHRDAEPPAEASAAAGPEDAVARLRHAVATGRLPLLSAAVRLRPAPSWSLADRQAFDRALEIACRALASAGAEQASRTESPSRRAELLLDALTCDELLPERFREEALQALARASLEAAARGDGVLPEPELLAARLPPSDRDRGLARLACLAVERSRTGLAVEALQRVAAPSALRAGLACEEGLSPAGGQPSWPRLDYPSGTDEESQP